MALHMDVDCIAFTGSTRVGRIIAKKAATQLKRCLLELGGKSPQVVLDDANIDEAVKAAVFLASGAVATRPTYSPRRGENTP